MVHNEFEKPSTNRLSNWRGWLLVACLALLGWLWQDVMSVASQSTTSPRASALSERYDYTPTSVLSVEGSGGLVTPGGEVTYQIRLLNWTDAFTASGAITHTLPAGFSYVPGSALVTVGGWPITRTEPLTQGGALAWGPFRLPAAGHSAHNPYGVHTFVQDLCLPEFIDFQLDQALQLVGSGGYVTQLFYRITSETAGPDPCAAYYVNAAYDRNLVPILRLQGNWHRVGFWVKPDPGPDGDYSEIAAAFARYVAGLPRRNTHPLYVTIWNEPDLWVEWSGTPSAWEYGRFFVAVSNAIRGLNDPRIRILNGATTPANTAFIQQLMAVPGFVNAFDAWASHCYPYNHPPWYNIHQRTARYGNTVIDCYIEERDVIARYGGRAGFKFVVTESGHGLGDNLYAFEGYPAINEANRASYIAGAFNGYWQAWPEVIAVTPFELGDPWSGWEWLDWIDYTVSLDPFHFSMTTHPQYNVVAALSKPRGATVPHGIEITFRARAADGLPLGIYVSQLSGAVGDATTVLTQTATVQVVARIKRTYLPLVGGGQSGGVWYSEVPSDSSALDAPDRNYADTLPGDGVIVPTGFLAQAVNKTGAAQPLGSMRASRISVGAEPHALAIDSRSDRAYVALADGYLAVVHLSTLDVEKRIILGVEPQALTPGPEAGTVYASLGTGEVIEVDTASGKVTARIGGLDRPRGLAFDQPTGRLLVADAKGGMVVGFSQDLSAQVIVHRLEDLPDQVLLDSSSRRLYVTLPGVRQVVALNADTLQTVATAELPGGPLIEAALDAARGRVYVLSALSPEYRGIAVLRADDLSLQALVAGSPTFPLKQAAALTVLADGQLVIAEGRDLYWVSPEGFRVVSQARLSRPVGHGKLAADPTTGRIFWAD